jgi:hypothetical protein
MSSKRILIDEETGGKVDLDNDLLLLERLEICPHHYFSESARELVLSLDVSTLGEFRSVLQTAAQIAQYGRKSYKIKPEDIRMAMAKVRIDRAADDIRKSRSNSNSNERYSTK